MSITRRTAIQALLTGGATALLPRRLRARSPGRSPDGDVSILYDSTRCIGCRECVVACAEANGGDVEQATFGWPRLSPDALTVLRRYEVGGEASFRKLQCMHCVDPACVSACMLGAMRKGEDGAVTWNGDLCVGCRYCEIACPFNVPRFEWDTPAPELHKCELCPERRAEGLPPACVEACHRGALNYGTRSEMIAEAHRRVASDPERYNPDVYGKEEVGGTSVLYLARAGVSFADLGLPTYGPESVPSLPETIQHTLYKGFLAPLALFGLFGALVRRNARRVREEETALGHHGRSEAVGGRILTWPFAILATLFLIGVAAIGWRFVAGLGAATNLNDGYAMGLWIAFDVVTGTALACGGYAVALLVYLANRGKYHPLVRAAIVTSALGYTLGGLSVLIDIGRAWNFYKIPLFFWEWNLNSILLEVALCIMLYTMVLWIELSPAFLEKWRESRVEGVRRFALVASPKMERAMPYLIALGLLLPTMHQSSLGSLMLLAGPKLHALWHTPLLPLLFLISCVAMGYAAVTLEATISSRVFKRPKETPMLRALAGPIAAVLLTYVAVRAADVAMQGKLGLVTRMDSYSLLFLGEMALFLLPALGLLVRRRRAGGAFLAAMGVTVILAGALYRFSTYLIAFDPGPEWWYFPSLGEFAVTLGLLSAELMGYVILVKRFPVLRGVPRGRTRGEDRERESGEARRLRPAPALGGAAGALAILALLPSLLGGQERQPIGDLRCLTNRPEQCLDEPVPADEPHGAVCSTCHNLWEQATLAEAIRSCTGARCHQDLVGLTPYHRGVHAEVLEDCVSCHRPHDVRIPGGGENCAFCHAVGGRTPPTPTGWAPGESARGREIAPEVYFHHDDHADLACTRCHVAEERHGLARITRLESCRSCHHTAPLASDCLRCHADDPERRIQHVTRTMDVRVGTLDRPQRVLPFDHALHEGAGCRTCHTEGARLGAEGLICTSCHTVHHEPDRACMSCHAPPAEGAHDVSAHLGCTGSGCHAAAPADIGSVPRTRELCLVCHQAQAEHMAGRNCVSCHILPPTGG